MSKRLEDMKFDELVDHATLEIHKGLLEGGFRDKVWVWMSQAIQWNKLMDEASGKKACAHCGRILNPMLRRDSKYCCTNCRVAANRRSVKKNKDGSPGKYENVVDSDLSTRAKNALIAAKITDAYGVKVWCKNRSHMSNKLALQCIENIGPRVAREILHYYRMDD